jgi:hypothetical protein
MAGLESLAPAKRQWIFDNDPDSWEKLKRIAKDDDAFRERHARTPRRQEAPETVAERVARAQLEVDLSQGGALGAWMADPDRTMLDVADLGAQRHLSDRSKKALLDDAVRLKVGSEKRDPAAPLPKGVVDYALQIENSVYQPVAAKHRYDAATKSGVNRLALHEYAMSKLQEFRAEHQGETITNEMWEKRTKELLQELPAEVPGFWNIAGHGTTKTVKSTALEQEMLQEKAGEKLEPPPVTGPGFGEARAAYKAALEGKYAPAPAPTLPIPKAAETVLRAEFKRLKIANPTAEQLRVAYQAARKGK